MSEMGPIQCEGCETLLRNDANFCTQCGRRVEKSHYSAAQSQALRLGGTFLVILILMSGTYYVKADGWSYQTRMYFELGIFSMSLLFFVLNIHEGKGLISLKNIRFPRILQAISVGIATSILVYFGIGFFNKTFLGAAENFYYFWYADFPYPKLAIFLFLAVGPAIFEELAFRSFLFNQLLRFFKPRITIVISGFFFALVHFSLISILWIFPFGLFLGYLRWRYNTIWYGVVLHFTHNFLVSILEQHQLDVLFQNCKKALRKLFEK